MSDRKPTVSEKNPYYISKHRFYELQHFCLQYPDWKKQLVALSPLRQPSIVARAVKADGYCRPTEQIAIARTTLCTNIKLVEDVAHETDPVLERYLLKAVTEGFGFDYLKTVMAIPCERDMYYARYRKFFYLLSQYRT